jgi:hypothetical protein
LARWTWQNSRSADWELSFGAFVHWICWITIENER